MPNTGSGFLTSTAMSDAGFKSLELGETLRQGEHLSTFPDDYLANVRVSIAQNEKALENLDLELEDQMRVIRQLHHKRNQQLEEIKRLKGLITLARRLPLEILASIFEECIRNGWTKTPIVVSSVCSSWRRAATSPTVWSHLYIDLDTPGAKRRTALWLQKSQLAPLSIHLEIGDHEDTTQLGAVAQILIEEAGRWQKFSFKSPSYQPLFQMFYSRTTVFTQLSSVDIVIGQELGVNDPLEQALVNQQLLAFRTAMLNAPKLQNLQLELSLLPPPNSIPTSITRLSVTFTSRQTLVHQSAASFFRVLRELVSIEELSFGATIFNMHQHGFDQESQGLSITLPRLKRLSMTGANNMFIILPFMKLPILSELVLRSTQELPQDADTPAWLLRFFETSPSSLTILEIQDLAITSSVMGQILSFTKSVRTLRLHDSDIDDATICMLCGPKRLCPSLEKIDIRWCGRLSGEALVELVRDRLDCGRPILEVTAINCSFVKEEDILNLAELTTCRLFQRGSLDFCCKTSSCVYIPG